MIHAYIVLFHIFYESCIWSWLFSLWNLGKSCSLFLCRMSIPNAPFWNFFGNTFSLTINRTFRTIILSVCFSFMCWLFNSTANRRYAWSTIPICYPFTVNRAMSAYFQCRLSFSTAHHTLFCLKSSFLVSFLFDAHYFSQVFGISSLVLFLSLHIMWSLSSMPMKRKVSDSPTL